MLNEKKLGHNADDTKIFSLFELTLCISTFSLFLLKKLQYYA